MPCKMLSPILEEIAGKNTDTLNFFKLNTDDNQMTPGKYNIMGIPSLVVFKNGAEIHRIVGVKPAEMLQSELDKVLAGSL